MGHGTLRAVGGPGSGQHVTVHTVVEIGRAIADSPQFNDPSISRRQARLVLDSSGQLTILDLGSRNGTRVNGRVITEATELVNGDVVDLGDTTFEVEDLEAEAAAPIVAHDPDATRARAVPGKSPATEPGGPTQSETVVGRTSTAGGPVSEPRPRAESGTRVRSRSIAAGLPVLPVKALIAKVRLRGAIGTLAVLAALWLAFYIQLESGNDPGLSGKPAAIVTPAAPSSTSTTTGTSNTTSGTSTTTTGTSTSTTAVTTKQS